MEIMYFSSPICVSCGMVGKYLEELKDIKIIKINILEQRELAISHRVLSVPTIIIKKDGKEINRHIGYIQQAELTNLVTEGE